MHTKWSDGSEVREAFLFFSLWFCPVNGQLTVDSAVCCLFCHRLFFHINILFISVQFNHLSIIHVNLVSFDVAAIGWTGLVSYFIRLPPVGSGTKLVWLWFDYISPCLFPSSIFVLSFYNLLKSLLSASHSFSYSFFSFSSGDPSV